MDRNNIINVNSVLTGIVFIDPLGRLVKDIDKMSTNELRAEVRVLRPVYETAKQMGYHRQSQLLSDAIAAVEAQDD